VQNLLPAPGILNADKKNFLPFTKIPRMPRSVNGDEWWFGIGFRKLPVFREAVKPRFVSGDRSHGATFFTHANKLLFH
jgi:hypothetical protein